MVSNRPDVGCEPHVNRESPPTSSRLQSISEGDRHVHRPRHPARHSHPRPRVVLGSAVEALPAGESRPPDFRLTTTNSTSATDAADGAMREARDLPAGDFGAWMTEMQGALRGERGSDVPCNGCTACCTSSQFIHITPDETDTLSRIPTGLLFPAPRMPQGHVLLGYDEQGHCPMLIDDKCSIYEHRPRTCRTYDCRVLPAAGVGIDEG